MQRRATGRAAVAFLLSLAGSVLFAIVYAYDGGPQLLGVTIALAFGGLGYGMAVWSKGLMPQGPFTEDRDKLKLGLQEEPEAAHDFVEGRQAVGRRRLLGGLLATAAGSLGLAALFPFRSLGPAPDIGIGDTGWAPGLRLIDPDGAPVRADTLPTNGVVTVFPEGRSRRADDQVVLVRVDAASLQLPAERAGWAPGGNLAYSRVCTHAGCPVGLYQPNAHVLLCPCHQATFNVVQGGVTVFGPAPKPLPQLPLSVDEDGFLVASSDFGVPVGPDKWRTG